LNFGGKSAWIALKNVSGGGHSFLCMNNVIMTVVALALTRAEPSRAEALAIKLKQS
jgi:hypothetical protein